jgi:hypothetical protein
VQWVGKKFDPQPKWQQNQEVENIQEHSRLERTDFMGNNHPTGPQSTEHKGPPQGEMNGRTNQEAAR